MEAQSIIDLFGGAYWLYWAGLLDNCGMLLRNYKKILSTSKLICLVITSQKVTLMTL